MKDREDEAQLESMFRKALSPLRLDRDMTPEILERLSKPTGSTPRVLAEPPTRYRWITKAALAASFLIFILAVYFTWTRTTPKGPSLPATVANIQNKPFDSAQDKPNEVTVEKDGFMVTLQSDKHVYEPGEMIVMKTTVRKFPKDADITHMSTMPQKLFDSQGNEVEVEILNGKESPPSQKIESLAPLEQGKLAVTVWFKLNTSGTYRYMDHTRFESPTTPRDFVIPITFTVRRKEDATTAEAMSVILKLRESINRDWEILKHELTKEPDNVGLLVRQSSLNGEEEKLKRIKKEFEEKWGRERLAQEFRKNGLALDEKIVPVVRLGGRLATDLSTPEKAWEALLAALKSGDEGRLKAVATEKGWESLKRRKGGNKIPGQAVQDWETGEDEATTYRLFDGTIKAFTLKRTPEGWKLDDIRETIGGGKR